jgi:hypothetical protein
LLPPLFVLSTNRVAVWPWLDMWGVIRARA